MKNFTVNVYRTSVDLVEIVVEADDEEAAREEALEAALQIEDWSSAVAVDTKWFAEIDASPVGRRA